MLFWIKTKKLLKLTLKEFTKKVKIETFKMEIYLIEEN